MDKIVTTETTLLTAEDKSILRKNTMLSIVMVMVIESFAYLMLFRFINDKDMEVVRWCFFGFFMLAGLVIIFMNVSSYLDKNKIVSTGYITNKRSHTRTSSGRNSSSRTDYYITLGDNEMSVMLNHYELVETGDRIRMHQTKWNKSIFRIEVLESAAKESLALSSIELHSLEMTIHNDYMDVAEKSLIRKKLLLLLFWRTLLFGGLCYILYYVLLIAVIVALPTELVTANRYLFVAAPAVVPLLLYVALNRKTFKVFLDFSHGKKRVMDKVVTNIVQNNVPMAGKHTVITTGMQGEYYYVTAHDKSFFQIGTELGRKSLAGDKITVHESFYGKIILKATEPALKHNI